MAAPLRSAHPELATSMQFAHFGVLDTGPQSKASTISSVAINILVAFVAIVIGAAAKQTIAPNTRLTRLIEPLPLKKPEPPPPPKITPPKPKPIPELAKVEPRIVEPRPIEQPKQPEIKMEQPKPVVLPAAPRKIVAMAAPKPVNLGHPEAASVPNNDAHPSAVRLGAPDSPIPNLHGPAVANVNLGRGMPGMNAANTGNGPAAAKVSLGSGSPESTSVHGRGAVEVAGIPHGVPGGTGTGPGRVAGPVNLGQSVPPPSARPTAEAASPLARSAPKVIYKPKPDYTQEARAEHIEGVVTIHIRVLPSGAVEIVGVARGLGHGLDESAERAIRATKFEPATDAAGRPITWDGIVNVAFQLAG
ncbi:MAG TPA: energy transducer TonB [Acidobacteriaceae bacterium]|nr:energy transducer TonB [Acidobacteriaceae bacterium]